MYGLFLKPPNVLRNIYTILRNEAEKPDKVSLFVSNFLNDLSWVDDGKR